MVKTDSAAHKKEVETDSLVEKNAPQLNSRPTNKQRLVIVAVAVLVALMISGVAVLVSAATQFGTRSPLSKLAEFLPVEQISGLKQLVKSPAQVLSRSVGVESDLNFHKSLNGRELDSVSKLDLSGVVEKLQFTSVVNINQLLAYSKNFEQFKQVVSVGGQFEAGAVTFNPGEEALKVEALSPNTSELYLKFNLSPQLTRTLSALTASPTSPNTSSDEGSEIQLEDFLDTYMKLNLNEYVAFIQETLPEGSRAELGLMEMNMDMLNKAYLELYEKLRPDMLKLYSDSVGDWDSFATVTYQQREKVGKRTAVWIDAQIDSSKFANASWQFVVGAASFAKSHRQDFFEYCQKTNLFAGEVGDAQTDGCQQIFGSEEFERIERELVKNPEALKKAEDGFKNFIKNMKFQKVRVAISPVDNSILKLEVEISMEKEGFLAFLRTLDLPERELQQFPLSTMKITMSAKELQRDHGFTVQVPSESVNLVEKLREYMQQEERLRKERQEEIEKEIEKATSQRSRPVR